MKQPLHDILTRAWQNARDEYGRPYSQRMIAKAADVTQPLISYYVKNDDAVPSPAVLQKMAHAFGLDEDYLLSLAGHRTTLDLKTERDLREQMKRLLHSSGELTRHEIRMLESLIDTTWDAAHARRHEYRPPNRAPAARRPGRPRGTTEPIHRAADAVSIEFVGLPEVVDLETLEQSTAAAKRGKAAAERTAAKAEQEIAELTSLEKRVRAVERRGRGTKTKEPT